MKSIFTSALLFLSFVSFSQEAKQLEDVFGVKAGLLGIWVHKEKALSNKFSLNAEIGYEGGIQYSMADKTKYITTTTLSLEPRYYYNFEKRQNKGKKTKLNSANYLAAEFSYTPDFLTSTNSSNTELARTFSAVPKYGLRRLVSKNIAFEFAFGLGYAWAEHNISGAIVAMDLRLDFKL